VLGIYGEDGDSTMRWDRVIGNTIITVTLTLGCQAYTDGSKWHWNDEINTLSHCKSGCD